jgi:hypothetical protein
MDDSINDNRGVVNSMTTWRRRPIVSALGKKGKRTEDAATGGHCRLKLEDHHENFIPTN